MNRRHFQTNHPVLLFFFDWCLRSRLLSRATPSFTYQLEMLDLYVASHHNDKPRSAHTAFSKTPDKSCSLLYS
jgi:hypothetical protein